MKPLAHHGRWIVLLALAALIGFSEQPLLGYLRDTEAKHAAELARETSKTETALKQLETDIAAARTLRGHMSLEEAEKILAPADRLRAAAELEHQANARRFEHFSFTLAPEEKVKTSSDTGALDLAQSTLTLAADMPLDTDGFAYLDHVGAALPGRLQLEGVTFERLKPDDPPGLINIHMKATLGWLSNGTATQGEGL